MYQWKPFVTIYDLKHTKIWMGGGIDVRNTEL